MLQKLIYFIENWMRKKILIYLITSVFIILDWHRRVIFTDMLTEGIIEKIVEYHQYGYSYRLIHYLLECRHNCRISFSYLQRKIIPALSLRRRGPLTVDFNDVIEKALHEISNGVAGAEQLRRVFRTKYNVRITRAFSRDLVQLLDYEGVRRRKRHRLRRRQYRSQGPNYVWHLDGYDKLSPYGIAIHGCIDGFSRKVIWLKAGVTNRRPEVVATYFLQSVENERGFPSRVRGDHGTENVAVCNIQRQILGADKAFIYGKSTSNQRIERWWGYLRQCRSDFWIHKLKILESEGWIVKENMLHRLSLQFVLLPVISKELENLRVSWNTHSIRRQRLGDTIPGIPDVLHTHPEITDPQCLHTVSGGLMYLSAKSQLAPGHAFYISEVYAWQSDLLHHMDKLAHA
ncbi:uncharacterized protein LOC123543857 isoform X2 [Mercenaria mercenaria]|uniref:uncharacterized protein LOC123543857 isoform X2 n=1 Tax=Mercenaria mercenaria TaxID=6596 RepID=UPI00234E83EB|nr:uncharacterized protein LOC123543857 isoform X2 [Mercenaria mercenaria]